MVQSFWMEKDCKRQQSAMMYYAHPFSSWERESNENGNRILRRFLPKGTGLSTLKPRELKQIEDWVNNYPRKIFGYKTANDMYAAAA